VVGGGEPGWLGGGGLVVGAVVGGEGGVSGWGGGGGERAGRAVCGREVLGG